MHPPTGMGDASKHCVQYTRDLSVSGAALSHCLAGMMPARGAEARAHEFGYEDIVGHR